MKHHVLLSLVAVLAITTACSDDPVHPDPMQSGDLQLSAAQANTIRSRIVQLAPVHQDLRWLADSISLVIGTGVTVNEVELATNLGTGPYYAVSLQRTITTSFSAASSFNVIIFNDPSNPTDFLIVGGWIQPGPGTPPTSVTGTFGTPTQNSIVTGHLLKVNGNTVTSWRVDGGTAAFSFGSSSGTCNTVEDSANVTCQNAVMNAAFNITSASSATSNDNRTASMASTNVDGIILRMTF
jgi:hypothetical protein